MKNFDVLVDKSRIETNGESQENVEPFIYSLPTEGESADQSKIHKRCNNKGFLNILMKV